MSSFLRLSALLLSAWLLPLLTLGAESTTQPAAPAPKAEAGKSNAGQEKKDSKDAKDDDEALKMFFPSLPHVKAEFYTKEDVSKQDTDFGMEYYSAAMIFPVWRKDKDKVDGLYLGLDASLLDLHGEAYLPRHHAELPGELYDLNFVAAYFQTLDNGWKTGGFVRVGSPSDEPFNSVDEVAGTAAWFLRMPAGGKNAWLVYLGYDSMSDLPYPMPGFGYWFENSKVKALLGLPVQMLSAEPVKNLNVDFRYIPIRNIFAKVAYGPRDVLQGYVSYDWSNKRYLPADRKDENDRLFFYDQKAKAGIEIRKLEHFVFDVGGGYVFGRTVFQEDKYADRRHNRITVDEGWFGGVSARVKF
jgi:hypothetical protein